MHAAGLPHVAVSLIGADEAQRWTSGELWRSNRRNRTSRCMATPSRLLVLLGGRYRSPYVLHMRSQAFWIKVGDQIKPYKERCAAIPHAMTRRRELCHDAAWISRVATNDVARS